jgi:ELWxxDGT repeat protein
LRIGTCLANVSGTLFFQANFDPMGAELWKSNGTASGTIPFKDIFPSIEPCEIGYRPTPRENLSALRFSRDFHEDFDSPSVNSACRREQAIAGSGSIHRKLPYFGQTAGARKRRPASRRRL